MFPASDFCAGKIDWRYFGFSKVVDLWSAHGSDQHARNEVLRSYFTGVVIYNQQTYDPSLSPPSQAAHPDMTILPFQKLTCKCLNFLRVLDFHRHFEFQDLCWFRIDIDIDIHRILECLVYAWHLRLVMIFESLFDVRGNLDNCSRSWNLMDISLTWLIDWSYKQK